MTFKKKKKTRIMRSPVKIEGVKKRINLQKQQKQKQRKNEEVCPLS